MGDTHNRQQPQPGTGTTVLPSGFTTLSLAILFMTFFFGGMVWWPALVLGITVAAIIAISARATGDGV